jgi:hypothetical protein
MVVGDAEDLGHFVARVGIAVGCPVKITDIDSVNRKVEKQKERPPKTKVIVTFHNLGKRINFYLNCRKFKHKPPQNCETAFRKLNVNDHLTYYKKHIFIMDYRNEHPEIIKNVWVSKSDIFIPKRESIVIDWCFCLTGVWVTPLMIVMDDANNMRQANTFNRTSLRNIVLKELRG